MALILYGVGRSWQGAYRDNNEDSFLTSSSAVAVADGVGGHAGGEVASAIVIQNLASVIQSMRGRVLTDTFVSESVATANFGVIHRVRHDELLTGMATTLTGLFRAADGITLGHIGDSRAYLCRAGDFHQVSRDDSYIQELIDADKLEPAHSSTHPMRSVVLKVLTGATNNPASSITLSHHEAWEGDRWLLTSDGLSDYVPADLIEETVSAGLDPEATADVLIDLAERYHSRDNVTVVVCDLVEGSPTPGVDVGGSALDLYGALPAPGSLR